MKIEVLQSQLKRKLATVKPAVAGKSSLPVLANVLLATDEGRLKIAATNLEIGITAYCGAKIENEGAVTVPAQLFTDVINGLPDDKVTLELDERTQTLNIKCGRTTANVKGIEADEFPVLPKVDGKPLISLAPDVLRDIASQVAIAAKKELTQPVLQGVLMRLRDDKATFAAADGFRMAVKTITLTEPVREPVDVLIPAKALQQFAGVLADVEDAIDVVVTPSGGQVLFQSVSTDCVSRLIDGVFPQFERLLPSTFTTRAVINRKEFAESVKLAGYFAKEAANIVKFTIDVGLPSEATNTARLDICANASEVGDNTTQLDVLASGVPTQIALDVAYVLEMAGSMTTQDIVLQIPDGQRALFTPAGDETHKHLIMGMTVRN